MRLVGLVAIHQRPNTSKPAVVHKIYPYLLSGLSIEWVDQVRCSDVIYIPMTKGFLYLVVIMDWVSRAVLAWRLSNTLGAEFCVEALEQALSQYGRPEIFDTARACPRESGGSQFASEDFTKYPEAPLDGQGRYIDNISSSGCGAASNTSRSTSTSMPVSPRPRPASPPGLAFITRSATARVWAIARRVRPTKQKAGGYVDDRLRRPAAPSPTTPPAQPPDIDEGS
jgi:hypothetical protein